jgi:hypothetical protein
VPTKTLRTAGACLAAALVTLPAIAAADPGNALLTVRSHTRAADTALTRAVTLFAAGRPDEATSAFQRSRADLGQAVAKAAALLRTAATPEARVDAARALVLVATQQTRDVRLLIRATGPAEGAVETRAAGAALSDVRGRDRALGQLRDLLARGVTPAAEHGLARAIVALSTARGKEAAAAAGALAGGRLGSAGASALAKTVGASLTGHSHATAVIEDLLQRLPDAAQAGLGRALVAIGADQSDSAQSVSALVPQMPPAVQTFVAQVAAQAQTDPQGMRTDRPAPPAADPAPAAPTTPGGAATPSSPEPSTGPSNGATPSSPGDHSTPPHP